MKDDEKRDEQDVTNLIERVVSDPMRGRVQLRYSLLPSVFLSARARVCVCVCVFYVPTKLCLEVLLCY